MLFCLSTVAEYWGRRNKWVRSDSAPIFSAQVVQALRQEQKSVSGGNADAQHDGTSHEANSVSLCLDGHEVLL
jgi:hypothetical protein